MDSFVAGVVFGLAVAWARGMYKEQNRYIEQLSREVEAENRRWQMEHDNRTGMQSGHVADPQRSWLH